MIEKKIGEEKLTFEGLVTEALPSRIFHVRLENDTIIIDYILGKIRSNSIQILMGDMVKIEISRYDSSNRRIIYTVRHKDSKRTEHLKDIEYLKDIKDLKDTKDSNDYIFLFSMVINSSSKIQAKKLILFFKRLDS